MLDVAVCLVAGLGWREEVALNVCASEFGECLALFGLFDAFGDGFEVECLCELHDGGDEPSPFVVAGDVVDESFVNFEDVDREFGERGEG